MEEQDGDERSLLRPSNLKDTASYHGEIAQEGQAFKENIYPTRWSK